MDKKLEKLESLLKIVNESLTKEEFLESFKSVINLVSQIEKNLIQKIDDKTQSAIDVLSEIQKTHKDVIKKIEEENKSSFSNMKRWAIERVNELFIKYQIKEKISLFDNKIKEIDTKLREVKDGYTPIKGKDYFDGSPDTANQILEKITGLLEISDIKDLQEEIKKLKESISEIPRGRGFFGGGVSKIALDSHFIDDETPVNSGDNINFTIAYKPSPTSSLKVYRNGQRLRITEDFTFSGRTITLINSFTTGEVLLVDYKI